MIHFNYCQEVLYSLKDLFFRIIIEIDQVQKNFNSKSVQNVLEAAADAMVDLSSSCLVDMCCTALFFLKKVQSV